MHQSHISQQNTTADDTYRNDKSMLQ